MILSTLENSTMESKARHDMIVYLGISLFCMIFAGIYEIFSHGVISYPMILMFLYPLLGGSLVYRILSKWNQLDYPSKMTYNLYNSGIALFTVGSCLKGVLDIYGTTSKYTSFYFLGGGVLCGMGIAGYVIHFILKNHSPRQ